MKCQRCGRELISEESKRIGYGPACAKLIQIKDEKKETQKGYFI